MQAAALSLVQKNSLQTHVDFVCVYSFYSIQGSFTLDGVMFCYSYVTNSVALTKPVKQCGLF